MSLPIPTYRSMWPIYARYWDTMHLTQENAPKVIAACKKIVSRKDVYKLAEKSTGVPWPMIGCLHMRESSANFSTQLAQGDPLNRVSIHVPKGRGPFTTWEAGAYDALVVLKGYNRIIDWCLEKILYYCEAYNGWGYWRYHNMMPSPYVWGASTIQRPGKYIADGQWSSTAWDTQIGCAIMLRVIAQMEKLTLTREA